jgi:preprotein translocase subunit SecE
MNAKVAKNTKPTNAASNASSADILKYVAAALLLAAGIFGYYWFGTWATGLRALLAAAGLVAALLVMAQTAAGRVGLEFFEESRFELRKVVWPTRDESIRTTGVIIVVIVAISIILSLIDFLLSYGVGKLLG